MDEHRQGLQIARQTRLRPLEQFAHPAGPELVDGPPREADRNGAAVREGQLHRSVTGRRHYEAAPRDCADSGSMLTL